MSTQAPPGLPGLMMHTPLLVRGIAERAEGLFADREIVSATADGIERSCWGEVVQPALCRSWG